MAFSLFITKKDYIASEDFAIQCTRYMDYFNVAFVVGFLCVL